MQEVGNLTDFSKVTSGEAEAPAAAVPTLGRGLILGWNLLAAMKKQIQLY